MQLEKKIVSNRENTVKFDFQFDNTKYSTEVIYLSLNDK